jgi:hypothetical protein
MPRDRCSCLWLLIAWCSHHGMSQHMFTFTFGSQSMTTVLMTPEAQNTDVTAFQHTGILYSPWLSIQTDVSTALKLISVKWWTHVSQCHHGFREAICSSFKWLKKWKSTCKHQFCQLLSCILLLYPSCTWMFGTVSQITPVQWINLKLCLDGFPKLVPPFALCSHVLDRLDYKV